MSPADSALQHATWARKRRMTPKDVLRSVNVQPGDFTTCGEVVDVLTEKAVVMRTVGKGRRPSGLVVVKSKGVA